MKEKGQAEGVCTSRSILRNTYKLWGEFQQNIEPKVGDGKSIKFWEDTWLAVGKFKDKFLFCIAQLLTVCFIDLQEMVGSYHSGEISMTRMFLKSVNFYFIGAYYSRC